VVLVDWRIVRREERGRVPWPIVWIAPLGGGLLDVFVLGLVLLLLSRLRLLPRVVTCQQ
jgi:hypothetical protein